MRQLKKRTENPTVVKFATTASDGKIYQVEYYNLDMILSVGYRVKSNRGIQFRCWANQVLKQHLLNGYSINRHLVALQQQVDSRFEALEQRVDEQQHQVEFLVDMHRLPEDRLFPTGCVFDAWEYVAALVRDAKNRIVLIDNYCDERTLMLLSKRQMDVECTIYDTVYILGDSLKNLGHSLTTVLKTSFTVEEILEKLRVRVGQS